MLNIENGSHVEALVDLTVYSKEFEADYDEGGFIERIEDQVRKAFSDAVLSYEDGGVEWKIVCQGDCPDNTEHPVAKIFQNRAIILDWRGLGQTAPGGNVPVRMFVTTSWGGYKFSISSSQVWSEDQLEDWIEEASKYVLGCWPIRMHPGNKYPQFAHGR